MIKDYEYPVDKKLLLSIITEKEIFEYYLNKPVDLDTKYYNPLRIDNHNNCNFFISNRTGKILFNDHAWEIFDCFKFVQYLYHVSFPKALQIIYNDIVIKGKTNVEVIDSIQITKRVIKTKIKIKRKRFTLDELAFWSVNDKLAIDEEILHSNKIYSLFCYWENDNYAEVTFSFAYHWSDYNYQLYFPKLLKGQRRFLNPSGIKYGDVEFVSFDESYILITKSKKDAFVARMLGINSMFIINEKILLDEEFMDSISHMRIFTLFDPDLTGKRLSVKYRRKYNTIPLFVLKGKDLYEFLDLTDVNTVLTAVANIKERYDC